MKYEKPAKPRLTGLKYNIPMRYETIQNLSIPKLGFGTWTIGGDSSPDRSRDQRSLTALYSALDLGYTHFDTAEMYAAGRAEELLGQAVRARGIARQNLFITSKVSPEHLTHDGVLHSCEQSLRRLGMDYIDLYLIHWPTAGMKLEDSFRALNTLVRRGQVRHLGVSNFNLKLLERSLALSETPLLTNQVSYSLADREYQQNGVLAYCQQHDILLTAYSPVKPRAIRSLQALQAVAQARQATRQQIALALLTSQARVITIPMSANPQHQAENLAAADIVLTAEEMAQLG